MAELACPLCGELASEHVAGQSCPARVDAAPHLSDRPAIRVILTTRAKSQLQQLVPNYIFDLVGSDDIDRLPRSIELGDKEWRFIRRFLRDEHKFTELCEELLRRKKGA